VSRVVHLVRHGEVDNPSSLFYGRLPGFSLSDRGAAQAAASAAHLARVARGAQLLSSPLERARETATILQEALAPTDFAVDERLIEAGSWRDGLPRRFAPLAHGLRFLQASARQQREATLAVIDRMLSAIRDAARQSEVSVLVSHQSPILLARVALERGYRGEPRAAFGRLSPWVYLRSPCDLASVTTLLLELEGEHMRLISSSYFTPE